MKKRNPLIIAVLIVIGVVAAFYVVVEYRYGPDQSIQRRLEARVASGADSFDFAAETPADWDRMFVFEAYTPQDNVERALNFKWLGFRRSEIESDDSVCLVVFVRGESVVHWYDQRKSIDLAELANGVGYTRTEAKFDVVRDSGRIALWKIGRVTTRQSSGA